MKVLEFSPNSGSTQAAQAAAVEKITGTPPREFRNFARKNANAWKAAK